MKRKKQAKKKLTFNALNNALGNVGEIQECSDDARSTLNGSYCNSINAFEKLGKLRKVLPPKLYKTLLCALEQAESALMDVDVTCDDIDRWLNKQMGTE